MHPMHLLACDVIDGHHFVTLLANTELWRCPHHNWWQSLSLPCDLTIFIINISKAILSNVSMSLSFIQFITCDEIPGTRVREVLGREDGRNIVLPELPTFLVRRCQIQSEFLWFSTVFHSPTLYSSILSLSQIKISSSRRALRLRLRMRNLIEK